jgi:hypothetical protein
MLRRGSLAGAACRVKLICVLHPVGPLPASVYWRRRVFALAVGLAALLVLWLVPDWGGGSSGAGHSAANLATTPAGTTTPAGSDDPTPAGGAPSDTLAATPPADDPGRPGDGDAGTGRPSSTAAAAAVVPPTCPDGALRLTVAPTRPDYSVGALPEITLSVRNASRGTCTRDLAASQQEVLLYAGRSRLWSSNDCYPGGGRDVQALAPGERDRFTVTWSGLSSRPKCAGVRTRVGPGRYSLVGRIGTLRSPPTTLILH